MAELYNVDESSLNFVNPANRGEWNNTDLTDPAALDGYLTSVGYDPEFLAPDRKLQIYAQIGAR
jgi:hypothetical protein